MSQRPPHESTPESLDEAAAARQKNFGVWAAITWSVVILVVTVLVAKNPMDRSVLPVYHDASEQWSSRGFLYHNPDGLNYLPHFSLLFMPFHAAPSPWGDVAWRWLSLAVFTVGIWRLCAAIHRSKADELFFWVSVLSIAACLGAIRNGQATTLLTGLLINGVVMLMQKRWTLASICLVLSLAVKPLGIVFILLAPLIYFRTWWRIALILPVFLAIPYLTADATYVTDQFHAFWTRMGQCAAFTDNRFADFNGMLRNLIHAELAARPLRNIGLIAAAATAGVWWFLGRRHAEPLRGLLLLALGCSYLILFNPMTESNGYLLLAPVSAACAMYFLAIAKRPGIGWTMAILTLTFGVLSTPMRNIDPEFALWWKPLATIMFIVIMIAAIAFHRRTTTPSAAPVAQRSD